MRQRLNPAQFRDSFALVPQPSLRNASLAGLQAALTAAIALPVVHLSPWSHLIGFAALGTLVALFGRFAPPSGRSRIVLTCAFWQTFAVLVMSLASWIGVSYPIQLLLLAIASGLFFFVSVSGQFGPPGGIVFIFAAGAAMAPVSGLQDILERTAATALVSLLAWFICVATERFRQEGNADAPFPLESVRPLGPRLVAAIRIGLSAGLAIVVVYAVNEHHPAWAAMGAVAVLQGTQLHIRLIRALQRMVGTLVGAGLAWLVLMQNPSVWVLLALVILLQFATEVIIGTNYALGLILVTPMALVMTQLAAPSAAALSIVPERVVDTLIGIFMGIIFAVIGSTLDNRVYLKKRKTARERS